VVMGRGWHGRVPPGVSENEVGAACGRRGTVARALMRACMHALMHSCTLALMHAFMHGKSSQEPSTPTLGLRRRPRLSDPIVSSGENCWGMTG
jgi:hypothetical protein